MGKKLENAINLYMHGIRDGHPEEAIERYTGAAYKQHSTGVKDGKEGFIEFFQDFIKRCPEREIEVIRGWEDGRYIFVQVYQNINKGHREWVTTDFFDTDENGKIIEHWDVISLFFNSTPSGHTTLDGPTEITDLDKTDANKQVVRNMIENVLFANSDPSKVSSYFAENLIQHVKGAADGRANFKANIHAKDRTLYYQDIVLLVGQGNFVATLCKASWDAQDYAQVDIFRLEEGLIVEHWDNVEPVPEISVNSGKF